MIAIIPIFFEGDQKFWLETELKGLLLKSATAAVKSGKIEDIFIFSNEQCVIELFQPLTKNTYLINIRSDIERSYSSIEYLQKIIKTGFEEIVILGFRNPLITTGLIDDAINKFKISRAPALISVKKSIDHPCQLNSYYRIMDVGLIHLFDESHAIASYIESLHKSFHLRLLGGPHDYLNAPDLSYKITKPFYFNWKAKGVEEENELSFYNLQVTDKLEIKYNPVSQHFNDGLDYITFPLWIYEGPNTARIIMQINGYDHICIKGSRIDKNFNFAGAQISDKCDHISSLLLRENESNRYVLYFNRNDNVSGPSLFRAFPVGLSNLASGDIIDVEISDFSEPISLQYENRDVYGIVYSLLSIAENKTYDICEYFPDEQKLWTELGQKINVKTGKEIMGRQDFPDVLEPEGTFFIIKKDLISFFDREVINSNTDGFVMDDLSSIRIESYFDLLRYRAIIRAAKGC